MIIPQIKSIKLDLPEIQSLDPQEIITEKLSAATKEQKGEFFIEDVSLYIDSLNGFPGPLIKWLLKSLKAEGIANLVKNYENPNATVKAVIGYTNGNDIHFFTGEIQGKIVSPKGESTFGFDQIFQPNNQNQTFAEMEKTEKNKISHRNLALKKLKEFLETRQ